MIKFLFEIFRGFKKTGISPLNKNIFDKIWKREEIDSKNDERRRQNVRTESASDSDSDYETNSDTTITSGTISNDTTSINTSSSNDTTSTNTISSNNLTSMDITNVEPVEPAEPDQTPLLMDLTREQLAEPHLSPSPEPVPSCSYRSVRRRSVKKSDFQQAVHNFKSPLQPITSTPKTSTRKRGVSQELTSSPCKDALLKKRLLEAERINKRKELAEKIDEAIKKAKL